MSRMRPKVFCRKLQLIQSPLVSSIPICSSDHTRSFLLLNEMRVLFVVFVSAPEPWKDAVAGTAAGVSLVFVGFVSNFVVVIECNHSCFAHN